MNSRSTQPQCKSWINETFDEGWKAKWNGKRVEQREQSTWRQWNGARPPLCGVFDCLFFSSSSNRAAGVCFLFKEKTSHSSNSPIHSINFNDWIGELRNELKDWMLLPSLFWIGWLCSAAASPAENNPLQENKLSFRFFSPWAFKLTWREEKRSLIWFIKERSKWVDWGVD